MPLYGVNDKVYVMMDGDNVHWSNTSAYIGVPYLPGICPLLGTIKNIGGITDKEGVKVTYYIGFLDGRVCGWFEEQRVSPNLFELAAKCELKVYAR